MELRLDSGGLTPPERSFLILLTVSGEAFASATSVVVGDEQTKCYLPKFILVATFLG